VPGGEEFTDEQKAILQALLADVSGQPRVAGLPVPELPATAPFSAAQRRHVNELLAGFMRTAMRKAMRHEVVQPAVENPAYFYFTGP